MSALRATDVAFAFSDVAPLFQDSRFHLAPGWTGLVGANGAGKSTLMRLFTRELRPTSGTLAFEPTDARVLLCLQGIEQRTPEIELLAEGADSSAHRLFGQLSLDPWEIHRWDTLSPGERKRWQIAAALWSEPDVLLLDEPTNHLDDSGRTWLLGALKRFRRIGVVVSHDRALLDALTSHTLRIHRGEVRLWSGAYSSAKEQWELEAHTTRRRIGNVRSPHTRRPVDSSLKRATISSRPKPSAARGVG